MVVMIGRVGGGIITVGGTLGPEVIVSSPVVLWVRIETVLLARVEVNVVCILILFENNILFRIGRNLGTGC